MNEQEKALKKMLEFCQWLIPNAKQFGLEQSKSIAMISQAQTPDDIVNGMNSLYQELGEEQFIALTQAFQQSKSQNIKMAKKGTKIDYLINKFQNGRSIPAQHKIDQRNIDLVERMAETANKPTRVSVEQGGMGYVTRAASDNENYTLNTNGRDSMMWWNPYGREVILSNSGPNRTWVGYTQIMEDDGPISVELNSPMLNKVKQHMFKKLNIK